jgi:hypothetical protein
MRRLPAVFLALVLSWSGFSQTFTNTYGTYFGGTGDKNAAVAVAVDPSGNAIMAGYTTSHTLPGTANAFQPTKATGYPDNQNVFVAKFDPTGRTLIWATFLGGDTQDTPVALAVDSQGGIYVEGTTESSNFPAQNIIACSPSSGVDFSTPFSQNCSMATANPNSPVTSFLSKISSDGTKLIYSVGLYGKATALTVDSQGEAYVGTVGPGVSEGLFLFKVNASGTGLIYGAFLGGGSFALAANVSSLVTDSLGNCYVAGTANINLPTTPNALQTSDLTPNTGSSFVIEVNATGSQLVYGTWFGAKYAATNITSMAVRPGGSIYFSGITTATTFQATSGAYETTPAQGFIAKLTPGMPALDAFSYLPSTVPVLSGSIVNGSPLPEVVFGNQPQAVYASFTVGPTGSKGFELAELDPQTLALLSSYTSPGTGFTTTSAALAPTNSVWLVGSVGSGSLGSLISANAYQTTPQSMGTSAVLIQLTDIAADTISPSANSLSFQWQTGSAVPAPQGVSVSGVVATAFTDSTSGGGWLSVSPGTGTTPATLSVAINPTGLNPGTYTGTITITAPTASNSPQTISVTLTVTVPLTGGQGPPQIGGSVCANSTLSGVYYYLLSGDLLSGNQFYPYIELGKLVANGQGAVSGNSHASIGGSISANTLSGTYSVQSSCTGSMALSLNSQPPSSLTFQVTNGGQGAVVAFSSPNGVVAGRAYRQTAATGTIQCATASVSGSYAYLLTGVAYTSGNGYYYSQAGSATGDGLGNMTVAGMVNVNGSTLSTTGQGPYSVASDCSGTASVKNQSGTANYFIAVAEDGQVVLFMESDSGYTVGGVADPTFVTLRARSSMPLVSTRVRSLRGRSSQFLGQAYSSRRRQGRSL